MSNYCSKNHLHHRRENQRLLRRRQPLPQSQPRSQSGFTLIELLVVCAVTGFIVLAATGIMVSFTKIKYSADVQVQLKTEATFAANQIDLLIRNSSGIPDLCISQDLDVNNTLQYCSGSYQQSFTSTGDTTCDVNKLTPEELTECWGSSKSLCVYNSVSDPDAPDDLFTTFNDNSNITYASDSNLNTSSAITPLYQKSYRYNMFGSGGFENDGKSYLIVQAARQEISNKPSPTMPESTFFNSAANKTCRDSAGNHIICQDLQTVYYNQVLYRKPHSGGNANFQLAIGEFEVGRELSSAVQINSPLTLFPLVRELVSSNGSYNSSYSGISTMYLTSQSVDVEDLTFECTLHNYGLPTQATAIQYTLTLTIPKESYNSQYEELDKQLYGGSSAPPSQRESYESYSITRLVTVRNGSQPFRYTQNN